jgi:hypothetical protein
VSGGVDPQEDRVVGMEVARAVLIPQYGPVGCKATGGKKLKKTQTQVPRSGSARRVRSWLGYGIVIPYPGYRIYIPYIYSFAIMHLGAFFIENAPTSIVIDLRSVATGLILVAIGSRPTAIKWSRYNWFVPSCNGSNSLYLVPSSYN